MLYNMLHVLATACTVSMQARTHLSRALNYLLFKLHSEICSNGNGKSEATWRHGSGKQTAPRTQVNMRDDRLREICEG